MRALHILTSIAVALAPLSALAGVRDAVMNKEGYWGIDVDNGSCAASMILQGGLIFLLRGHQGEVTFGLFSTKDPIREGKTARIQTDAEAIDFKPYYSEKSETLFNVDPFDARALATLRQARQAQVLVDGRAVAGMTLEGTGFEGAIDGVIACSKGESGWWGKGVQADDGGQTPPGDEGRVWTITRPGDGTYCLAEALAGDEVYLQFVAAEGLTGIGVVSAAKIPRGRKARIETDASAFEFKPSFDAGHSVLSAEPFDSQQLAVLRRAKWLRVKVDSKTVVDVSVEETDFAGMLYSVEACSRGEKGWWGEGAKPQS